eukprot:RCo055720
MVSEKARRLPSKRKKKRRAPRDSEEIEDPALVLEDPPDDIGLSLEMIGEGAEGLTDKERFRLLKDKVTEKRGIVLVNPMPRGMNPSQLRLQFQIFGDITNMRVNSRPGRRWGKWANLVYTQAWVEFRRRRDAKTVAQALNASPIQASLKKAYRDEMWCIKYLKGFTWEDLLEEDVHKKQYQRHSLREEREKWVRYNKQYVKNYKEYAMDQEARKDPGGWEPIKPPAIKFDPAPPRLVRKHVGSH